MASNITKSKRPPFPKRKVAIMLGYCGSAYQGMQMNIDATTIESELFKALVATGHISQENSVDPKKISWMRSCRTDKGVHAASQLVSLKMLLKITPTVSEEEAKKMAVKELNEALPKDIRVYSIIRCANSFHAKELCDSRVYEYLLPTYSLSSVSSDIYSNPPESIPEKTSGEGREIDPKNGWICKLNDSELNLIKSFRCHPALLQNLENLLKKYNGTHKFHNFTIGKTHEEPSSTRHMWNVSLGKKPFIQSGIEWISILFHGQSFMLHQIRKMVGLVILTLRLDLNHSIIDSAFQPTKINIPKAPSLGLLLDKAIFSGYNKRFGEGRERIDFEDVKDQIEKCKADLIYPKIYNEETQFNRFMGWLKCNDEHASEFSFLLPFIKQNAKQ